MAVEMAAASRARIPHTTKNAQTDTQSAPGKRKKQVVTLRLIQNKNERQTATAREPEQQQACAD